MMQVPEIDELASRLRLRRAIGDAEDAGWSDHPGAPGPYILFLGAGCAAAAGAPSTAEIARRALDSFKLEGGAPLLPDEAKLVKLFYKHVELMPPAEVARMLQALYARVAVPSFYLDLARLIRRGWFPQILTTSYDNLLEKALDRVGVPASRIQVTTLARGQTSENRPGSPEASLVSIVKLHGDLAQSVVQLTPTDIARALNACRRLVSDELLGHLIVVGHTAGDDPVDHFFAKSPDRELWWVSEQPQPPGALSSWANEVHHLVGEIGRPQAFFAQLSLRLLDPAPAASEPGLELASDSEPAGEASFPGAEEAIRGEIMSSQFALYNLDQEFPPSSRPASIQAQIEYQKRQISRLEDRMLLLPDVRFKLLDVLGRIWDGLVETDLEPLKRDQVEGFLKVQIDTLRTELEKDAPNELVVSGTLGATLALADRLSTDYGPAVVDRRSVAGLAAFAPSAAGKVVL